MSALAARRAFPFACVIIASTSDEGGEPAPDARVDDVVAIAHDAGAEPIVAVVGRGVEVAPPARRVDRPRPARDDESALRVGVSQLTNSSVNGALLWPAYEAHASLEGVLAVIDLARRGGAPIVVPVHGDERLAPAFVVRDLWRELLTTPGGFVALAELHAERTATVDVRRG